MISPGCSSVSALLAEVTDTSPQCQLTNRNAITWKTGNSGCSASFFFFFKSFSQMEPLCHVSCTDLFLSPFNEPV